MAELKITRGHSCVPCQHRKIRCNGQAPCAYCIKTGKDCVRPPRPLQSANSRSIRGAQGRPATGEATSPGSSGQVIASGDQRRYVEDNKLWTSLSDELDPKDANESTPVFAGEIPPSAPTNLIFGRPQLDSPEMLHPSAIQSFRLWQVYLSNVHPLTKILHGPSVQEETLRVLSDPSATERSMEALMFSIYLIAVVSLTDEECRNLLDEPREKHLIRYRCATESALSRVDFLRSTDLRVLQAFTIYLLALRHLCDHDILWLLTGLATRMGQRMGLHRESSLKGLSPFEAEMRRRLWWQIIILDGRAAQMAGASMNPNVYLLGDTKPPANVNDGDLVPSMSSGPISSPVTTEMVFCSVRIEIGVWMMQQKCLPGFSASSEGKVKFLKSVDELEKRVEDKYLKNIDKDIPLNYLTVCLARSAISQLRLSVIHPMHHANKDADLSPGQLDMLLKNSLEVIRFDVKAHTTPSLRHFLWHISNFFPFETFILLVNALYSHPNGALAGRAWDMISRVYEHHPSFISEPSEPLSWALGNLTLKAWSKRLASNRESGLEPPAEPPCITKLLHSRISATRTSQPNGSVLASSAGTGPETPRSLARDRGQPTGIHAEMAPSKEQLQQETYDAFATFVDNPLVMTDDNMDMDWDFWQDLLANTA